jgi:valyl-tRNA synthetase
MSRRSRTSFFVTTRPELLPACVAVFVHPDDGRYAQLVGAGRLMIACHDQRLRAALQECALDIQGVTRAATLEWREAPADDLQEAAPSLWVGIEG